MAISPSLDELLLLMPLTDCDLHTLACPLSLGLSSKDQEVYLYLSLYASLRTPCLLHTPKRFLRRIPSVLLILMNWRTLGGSWEVSDFYSDTFYRVFFHSVDNPMCFVNE